MCMKNMNASIFTCVDTQAYTNGVQSFIGIYDTIVPKKQGDKFGIENFNVIVELNIIFSKIASKNEFLLDKDYDFKVRLTHIDTSLGTDIHEFSLRLTSKDLTTWCKDFYEATHTIRVPYLYLPKGMGNYALKLLVKEKDSTEDVWTVQTIKKLIVGGSC